MRAVLPSPDLTGSPSIQTDDMVPPFEGLTLTGERLGVAYDGSSRYLIFIFPPQCSSCIRELPLWNRLALHAKSKNIRALGVSIDPPEISKLTIPGAQTFPIVTIQNRAIQRAYRLVAIPLVVAVSSRGKVEWTNYGELSESKIAELNAVLDSKSSSD